MQYKVLFYHKVELLEQMVNELLTDGWVLQGGVSVAETDNNSYTFAQALVKHRS